MGQCVLNEERYEFQDKTEERTIYCANKAKRPRRSTILAGIWLGQILPVEHMEHDAGSAQ